MSGDVSDKKRLVSITKGNPGNNDIYIRGHHDFFPADWYGKSSGRRDVGKRLSLLAGGYSVV